MTELLEWLVGAIFHQLIPPFTAEAKTIAHVDETTTNQRKTAAAL